MSPATKTPSRDVAYPFRGAVAALVLVHAEVVEDSVLRVQETHGQQQKLGRHLVLASIELLWPSRAPISTRSADGAQGPGLVSQEYS